MKRSLHTLILSLSMIFIGGLVAVNTTSALEFQTDPSGGASNNPITLKFNFGETLTITTGGNIAITGLVPGASDISASNYVVTVNTNNTTGYTLSATVGCETGTDCYDSKNLSDGTNNFTMLSSTGTLTAGTWGVSLDSGATKSSNFQPIAKWDDVSPTTINQTTNATGTAATGYQGTNNTTVRIGAYAASNQATGTYTNVINFIAVTNMSTADSIYMQDQTASSMAQLLPYVGYTTVLTDRRDGTKYTVAKLSDNKYWMVGNLDLAGGTALSASDTDVDASYVSSFTTSNNLTKDGNTIVLPASSTSGFGTNNYSYVYNSNSVTCSNGSPCYSYYSWDAATLGSGRNIATDDTDAPYSICPKGWHLPNTRTGTDSTSDFRALIMALGGSSSIQTYNSSTTPTGTAMSTALQNSPSNYVLAGIAFDNSVNYTGLSGNYWSATSYYNDGAARSLDIDTSVEPADGNNRYLGFSVRCVFGS